MEELAFSFPPCLEGLSDRLKKVPDLEVTVSTLHCTYLAILRVRHSTHRPSFLTREIAVRGAW